MDGELSRLSSQCAAVVLALLGARTYCVEGCFCPDGKVTNDYILTNNYNNITNNYILMADFNCNVYDLYHPYAILVNDLMREYASTVLFLVLTQFLILIIQHSIQDVM